MPRGSQVVCMAMAVTVAHALQPGMGRSSTAASQRGSVSMALADGVLNVGVIGAGRIGIVHLEVSGRHSNPRATVLQMGACSARRSPAARRPTRSSSPTRPSPRPRRPQRSTSCPSSPATPWSASLRSAHSTLLTLLAPPLCSRCHSADSAHFAHSTHSALSAHSAYSAYTSPTPLIHRTSSTTPR